MDNYNISLATKDDLKDLKNFINNHWKKNHIFTSNDDLLNFQHKSSNHYNFVISRNSEFIINGILGFIPTSHFDPCLKKNNCLWLAIWKVDEKISKPGLGLALLRWLEEKVDHDFIGTVGQNEKVNFVYKALGYNVGKLNHYYVLNSNLKEFKILKNLKMKNSNDSLSVKHKIEKISINDISNSFFRNFPIKSKDYIINRFLNHPFYKYHLYGVNIDKKLELVFIIRQIIVSNSSCLRIVDMYGNFQNLKCESIDFNQILDEYNSEYIDCLNYGISENHFKSLGFHLKDSEIIIPEYFEPFVQENRDTLFAFKPKAENYYIFKADCDQDRPNNIL